MYCNAFVNDTSRTEGKPMSFNIKEFLEQNGLTIDDLASREGLQKAILAGHSKLLKEQELSNRKQNKPRKTTRIQRGAKAERVILTLENEEVSPRRFRQDSKQDVYKRKEKAKQNLKDKKARISYSKTATRVISKGKL